MKKLHNNSNGVTKPPLGLIPKWIRQEERQKEICQAIIRYFNANKKIPIEWIEEFNKNNKIMKSKKKDEL